MSKPVVALQTAMLAVCGLAIALLVLNFPFPSPLIRPLLPAQLRWPEAEVKQWVEAEDFSPGFMDFFARDPERTVPPGSDLVSPSDGIVKDVSFRDGVTYLVIGLSFWDVHVVRTPLSGVVTNIEREGTYYSRNDSASELRDSFFLKGKPAPVQEIVSLASASGPVKVRLITSYWASRLKVWVHIGEKVDKGQRIGRILLGSTVVFELPGRVGLRVSPGQRVVAGETVISRTRGTR